MWLYKVSSQVSEIVGFFPSSVQIPEAKSIEKSVLLPESFLMYFKLVYD